jgi:hypothetical protein
MSNVDAENKANRIIQILENYTKILEEKLVKVQAAGSQALDDMSTSLPDSGDRYSSGTLK